MLARNNRGIVTIRDVTRIAIAMEPLNKHVCAETYTQNKTIEDSCFLWGPRREVIKRAMKIVCVSPVRVS
jgi:hypothetical protein